jgi:hypothetical protein
MISLGMVTEPVIISRRKKPLSMQNSSSVRSLFDWSDPRLFSQFDLIFVACSLSNIPLVQEITQNQIDYSNTVFFCTTLGVPTSRLEFIFKSHLIVTPFMEFDSKPMDHNVSQNVVFLLI